MRKLEFRAWDGKNMWDITDNSQVVLEYCKISGWNIVPNKSGYTGKYLAGESNGDNETFILMQSTGLKDGKGKEIFEGDILVPERYLKSNRNGFKCEVIMDKGMFHFKTNGELIQEIKPLYKSLLVAENAENPYVIIGNCYEPSQNNGAKPLL